MKRWTITAVVGLCCAVFCICGAERLYGRDPAAPAAVTPELAQTLDVASSAELASKLAAQPELILAQDRDGATLLHHAARLGLPEAVELLLDGGAGAGLADRWGRTPLHEAARANHVGVIDRLVQAGAAVDVTDRAGETPLHLAARRGRSAAAERLIALGAAVNAKNSAGRTPLHLLADQGPDADELDEMLTRCAGVLIEAGADANAVDAGGRTALDLARGRGHQQLAAVLAAVTDDRVSEGDEGEGPDKLLTYRTYAEIGTLLLDAETNYPGLAKRYDLGQSVQGRSIWALRISDNVLVEEDEPEVAYISTMHGDEIVGNEMCLYLIDHLLTQYGVDPRITTMVDELEMWIVPLMNPDGYDRSPRMRFNVNGFDLNRSFPDPFTSPNNTTAGRQPEVAVIMNWTWSRSLVLGANLHGGALLANYPMDTNPASSPVYSASPDDDVYIWLSETYSQHNLPMWNSPSFFHGITNGAAWYDVNGSLQDWSHRYNGQMHVTLELNNTKEPAYSTIPTFWSENRESMLSYFETALTGIRGVVTDNDSGLPVAATLRVVGRAFDTDADPDVGDYHRILRPGTYGLEIEAAGYDKVIIDNIAVSSGNATRVDVTLGGPAPAISSPNGGEIETEGQPVAISWSGDPLAEYQVQYTLDADVQSVDLDDFEGGTIGPDYLSGGSAVWAVTTTSAHGGVRSLRAGAIGNEQRTWIKRVVENASQVSFWSSVSSEGSYDFFNFYIDGALVHYRSGNGSWQQFSAPLSAGEHTLMWEYVKDSGSASGSDTAWVDDIQVTADVTQWVDIVNPTAPGATGTSWAPPTDSTNAKVRVRAHYGNGAYGQWDESDAPFEILPSNAAAPPLAAAPPHDVSKDRYVSFDPNNAQPVAIEVSLVSSEYFPGAVGVLGWVGAPDGQGMASVESAPVYRVWTEPVVHLGDCRITPAAEYQLRATQDGALFSAPLAITTTARPSPRYWGDLVGGFNGVEWTAPEGNVNGFDINAVIKLFQVDPTAPHITRVDINPQQPDGVLNGTDILQVVKAFQIEPYPFVSPDACP